MQFPLGETLPLPGVALPIRPGVKWVRMPLPFALDHINLWLLEDEVDGIPGWTLVDCGITRDEVKALWEQVYEKELEGKPLLRVVVTHMHPDHVGLAHWHCERWNAPLYMSMTDYAVARLFAQSASGPTGERAARHFARHGLSDPAALAKIRARGDYYAGLVPRLPESFSRLMDGGALRMGGRTWQLIAGYGHAPEHISLYCAELKLLIAGDMLLPKISTNVSVFDTEPDANPLPLFLQSIERFRLLPPDTLVLPSHGRPFVGIPARLDQLQAHHAARLQEVFDACKEAKTAAEIVPILFPRALDLHQLSFALGEALAHLHALWRVGGLARLEEKAGEEKVYRFRQRR